MAFHSKWKRSAQVTSQAFRASLTETRRRFRDVHRFIVSLNCHITPWFDIADKEEGSLTPSHFPPFYCFVCVFEVCWVRGALAIHFYTRRKVRLCWHSLATLLDTLFYCLTTKKLTSHTRQRIGTFGHVDTVETAWRSSKRASEWGRKQKWHWRRWTWCKQQTTAELLGCSRTTVSRACGEEENTHCEKKSLVHVWGQRSEW